MFSIIQMWHLAIAFLSIAWPSIVACSRGPRAYEVTAAQPQGSSLNSRSVIRRNESSAHECMTGPASRRCWDGKYDINTDFEKEWPDTGNTVHYTLTVGNTTCNPDGSGDRICLLVNNQYPGPTIFANWGDKLQIEVVNDLQDNGTSIHWHGLRQWYSNDQDGTSGVSECPLAPGQRRTYNFQATQYGSFWYHSHFSSQYGDGVLGSIVIDGPSTADYDIDLGPFVVTEWFSQTASTLGDLFNQRVQNIPTGDQAISAPLPADNVLINGVNKSPQGGRSLVVDIEAGKRYKLRLLNGGVDNAFRVSLDGHPFQVITADPVPVHPITVESLLLNTGQRYDVIITANQTIDNYFFQANNEAACLTVNLGYGRAIFRYKGAPNTDPATNASQISNCDDVAPLVPQWPGQVPKDDFASLVEDLGVNIYLPSLSKNKPNVVVWGINFTSIDVSWEKPVVSYLYEKNTSYPPDTNVVTVPDSEEWVYWIIQEVEGSVVPIGHPMHLHGHDFYVLGAGPGIYSSSSVLNFENPVRRDSASLPGGGWLALAFKADNPGAWLMHCHIAWHIGEGLGVTFIEKPDQVQPKAAQYDQICEAWVDYAGKAFYAKSDSGL